MEQMYDRYHCLAQRICRIGIRHKFFYADICRDRYAVVTFRFIHRQISTELDIRFVFRLSQLILNIHQQSINLAAGYIEIKQYEKSISLLENLAGRQLPGSAVKMVCRLDLCMSYFYVGQYEKAMSLYNENQKLFGQYRNDKTYGGHIAVADILALMRNGQYDQAEKLLDTAQRFWEEPRLQNAFQEIGKSLIDMKKENRQPG